MKMNFACDYIAHRMQVMGYGTDYVMQFRHYIIRGANPVEFDASADVYFLIGEIENVLIESAMGIYDLSNMFLSEQLHEHTGKISIRNKSAEPAHLRMIQVTPLHPTLKSPTENAHTV